MCLGENARVNRTGIWYIRVQKRRAQMALWLFRALDCIMMSIPAASPIFLLATHIVSQPKHVDRRYILCYCTVQTDFCDQVKRLIECSVTKSVGADLVSPSGWYISPNFCNQDHTHRADYKVTFIRTSSPHSGLKEHQTWVICASMHVLPGQLIVCQAQSCQCRRYMERRNGVRDIDFARIDQHIQCLNS